MYTLDSMEQLSLDKTPGPNHLAKSSIGASEAESRPPPARLPRIQTPQFPASTGRKQSIQSSSSTASPPSLPSPNVTAAHAYYLDNVQPIESSFEASQRRKSLVDMESFPRRHSVMTPAGTLARQLESFNFPSANPNLPILAETDEFKNNSPGTLRHAMEKRQKAIDKDSDRRDSEVLREPQLRQVPFEYTHDHLREWGHAYLGNSATADAFVNAVSLRRPSLAVGQDEDFNLKSATTHLVIVRARVLPKSKTRKPFLIQRQLDIDDLRSSISNTVQMEQEAAKTAGTTKLRRSTRLRRGSAQHTSTEYSRRESVDSQRNERSSVLGKGPIPIHIEYALHYLPVLAALMLSGHVRKGDTIDLPIPYPEAWCDVVAYIYTGRGEMTAAIRENITFLAGHT